MWESETETSKREELGQPWPDLNDGLLYKDVVSASESGLTLIHFYSTKHKNSAPLQGWLQRIQNGQIRIDGRVVKDADWILRGDSELVYHRLPWKEPDAPYLLQLLYHDHHMIALNKPSGLQVLPGGLFQQRTVLKQLEWWHNQHKSSLSSQEASNPVPVHRLGRGTSGILLCAKTKLAKTRLAAYFADGTSVIEANSKTNVELCTRKISKIYRALVNGIMDEDKVIINQPIGIMRYPGVAKGLYVASSSGKPALSKVAVLQRDVQENCTLVEVEIQSGRPHQIRIHLAFIGHTLVGDPLYVVGGQPKSFDAELADESYAQDGGYQRPVNPVPGECGYLLHAHKLVLSHPITNEVIKISAPLPPTLKTRQEAEEMNS